MSRPFNHYGSEQFTSYCCFMMTWPSFRIKNQKHLCCLRCICLVHFSNIQPSLENSGDNPSGSFSYLKLIMFPRLNNFRYGTSFLCRGILKLICEIEDSRGIKKIENHFQKKRFGFRNVVPCK